MLRGGNSLMMLVRIWVRGERVFVGRGVFFGGSEVAGGVVIGLGPLGASSWCVGAWVEGGVGDDQGEGRSVWAHWAHP
jgi:hypothetical protein